MSGEYRMSRRAVLGAVAAGGVTALAGCGANRPLDEPCSGESFDADGADVKLYWSNVGHHSVQVDTGTYTARIAFEEAAEDYGSALLEVAYDLEQDGTVDGYVAEHVPKHETWDVRAAIGEHAGVALDEELTVRPNAINDDVEEVYDQFGFFTLGPGDADNTAVFCK